MYQFLKLYPVFSLPIPSVKKLRVLPMGCPKLMLLNSLSLILPSDISTHLLRSPWFFKMADFNQNTSGLPLDILSPSFSCVLLSPLSFESTWIILYLQANFHLFLLSKMSNLAPVVEVRLFYNYSASIYIFFIQNANFCYCHQDLV